jgi:hypothetical protein
MPASIRVDSGISAGSSYWIERAVLRVGSDPQADICLPSADLAPHALTLEFHDGIYRVYNRSTSPVTVGSTIVQPGANAVWSADATIRLPGDLRIALEVDGDPRPTPRADSRDDEGFGDGASTLPMGAAAADAATDEAAAKKSKGSLMQMAVIGVCVLAMAAMLLLKNAGGGESSAAADRPTFNELVTESNSKDPAHQAIVRRLQFAQAAIVRFGYDGNKHAHERFSLLRDHLVSHVDSLSGDAKKDAERVLSYVEYRLGQL